MTQGDMLDPKSTNISSSSMTFKASKKYFGLNPASKFVPSVETYSSSFASPVWFAQEIVTFPTSIFIFTGYFFSFSIDEAEIRIILSKQFCISLLFTFILVSQLLGIALEYFKNKKETK